MYSHLLISLTDADVESPQSSITAHNMFSDVVAQVLQSRTELHASTFDKQLFMLSLYHVFSRAPLQLLHSRH